MPIVKPTDASKGLIIEWNEKIISGSNYEQPQEENYLVNIDMVVTEDEFDAIMKLLIRMRKDAL
jgi:hypothetical protein